MLSVKKKRAFIVAKRFLLAFLLLVFFALLLTFFLEFRYFGDLSETWEFVTKNCGRVFLFNSFITLIFMFFVYAVTLKPWISVGLISVIIIIISYINENKLASRMTPLLPEDFELATEVHSLTKFVDAGGLVLLVLGIIITIFVAVFMTLMTKRFFTLPSYLKIKKNGNKRHFVFLRVFLFATTFIIFLISTSFIINNAGIKYQHVDFLGTTFTAWNQDRNYRENGLWVGFLYNCNKFEIKKPSEYSKKAIDKIAKEYNDTKNNSQVEKRQSLTKSDYNIVIILNESFYDPSILSNYYQYSGGDITPNLHRIMRDYPSGQMYSLDYGGGTANIEFEALTGLTNYYANTVPYTNLIPKAGEIPSIATWGKKNGYKTTAIHTYYGGMYKRNISLKNEGFDDFITSLEIENPAVESGSEYYNDKTAYKEVLQVIDNSDEKQIIALITMQNHTPFGNDLYNGKRDFKIANTNENTDVERIETYFQLLNNSDKYLGEFINGLENSNEKTVVLFFGDHSPGVFQKVADDDINLSRLTPYFIYNNFDLNLGDSKLPTTTPNCLVNTLYDRLNVEKPTLNYLLDEVCTENPILTAAYYGDDGLVQTETLGKYENVTYDILNGKKYWMNIADW